MLCLGAGLSLLLLGFRLADNAHSSSGPDELTGERAEDETAWELT